MFGIDINNLDISNASDVSNFFNKNVYDPPINFDYVIHCAAATNTSAIEKDPERFYATNCLGPRNLARSCAYNGIKMIFISTDYVLSELSPEFGCEFQEFPVNQYGLQKLIAEQFVKEEYKNKAKDYMILRSSWMFGNSDHSFVEKFLENVFSTYAKNKEDINENVKIEIPVADDAYGRPTPVWFIANKINELIQDRFHGVTNLQYSLKQISRYEWAKMIWNAFTMEMHYDGHKSYNFMSSLIDSIKIVSRSSSDIGVQIHHPGKVGCWSIMLPNTLDAYVNDINLYVRRNKMKYIDLAKKIINGD